MFCISLFVLLVIVLAVFLRPMASDCPFCYFSFGHCIGCHSSTYGIRLPLLSFFFWSLYWLLFFDLRHQIAPFVIFLLAIILVVILWPTASDCPFCHFSFGHCIGCHSSTYGIILPLCHFFFVVLCHFGIFMMNTLVISLSVLVWLVCHFGIFTPFLHISRNIQHRIYFLSIIISFTSTNYTKSHWEC